MAQTPSSILRKVYMNAQSVSPNQNDLQYIQKLKKLGLKHHPSLFPSFFQLKNGLSYPGMATKNHIGPKEKLVQVPQSLILSSIQALKEPNLSDVFSQQFYNEQSSWEDRVLITYLLYLYSKEDKQNIFYWMLEHMSKDIDICCFWQPSQLEKFKDKTVKSAAINDLKAFEEQWDEFSILQSRYSVLQHPKIIKQNYQWIFVHISSRCFGKYIDYTSFVPFCEFFNHHSSSVAYQVNNIYSQQISQQQELDQLSSNQSDGSIDYLQQGQFNYHQIQPLSISWCSKECFSLNKKQKQIIKAYAKQIIHSIEEQINWEDFSILFIGKIIERVKMIQSQYIAGRKNFKITQQKMKQVEKMKQKYILFIRAYYQASKPKSFIYNKKQQNNQKKKFIRPTHLDYKPTFSEFSLKTFKNDNFQVNNEVYFCYGRNSNRTLLLRYGFAIQGNKYEHVWLSFDISLPLKYMPDLVLMVQQKGLSLRRKFKIKHTSLNIDLIIFHRLCNWNLYNERNIDEIFYIMNISKELNILEQVKQSLKHELLIYESNTDLTDKDIGYHEYFMRVYHKQKIQILSKQIHWISLLQQILVKVNKGTSLQEATKDLSSSEKHVLSIYFDTLVI